MAAEALHPTVPETPQAIHNCPACGHWLPEGTLACPDCQTLAYGQFVGSIASDAQRLEAERRFPEARQRWTDALAWLPENSQQAEAVRNHIALIDQRKQAEADRESRLRKKLGPLAPVALFLLKAKSAIFVILKFKFLLSFLAYFAIYWALFDWKFAAGFTVSLLIHELGHYVALRRRGIKPDLPVFIPFMGAYVRWWNPGMPFSELAAIALAGPLYGLCAALACFAIFLGTHHPLFLVLANVGAWINLINLAPVLGLDGARATYALSTLQRGLIAALCFVFFALTVAQSGGNLFAPQTQWVFAILGAVMAWRLFTRDQPEEPHTPTMAYFCGLILALGLIILITAAPLLALTSQS